MPALHAHALMFVQRTQLTGRGLVAALLHAVAQDEEQCIEPLPAQVVGQGIGIPVHRARAALEAEQEHAIREFVAIALQVGKTLHFTGYLRKQCGLAQ
ncbi:hypothetical protein D3C76_1640720 [compost metagenome]